MKRVQSIIYALLPVFLLVGLTAIYMALQTESKASIGPEKNAAPAVAGSSAQPRRAFGRQNASPGDSDRLAQLFESGLSRREFRCLAQAIYFEARGESYEGQVAVAHVIMNRVESPRYPNSICGVVFQNEHMRHLCQFSFACDGRSDNPYEMAAWRQAQRIAEKVLLKNYRDVTNRSTHYHADYVSPSWANHMQPTMKVGTHIFYREES